MTGLPQATEELTGDGKRRCPWCNDYYGAFVKKHASKAHPDQYREWRENHEPVQKSTTEWRKTDA